MNGARWLVVALAIGVGALGVVRGTWAVGGSDSSCYGLMAQAFASGALQPTSWLAREAPWPQRALTVAPGGFVPSPVHADAASPVCAPGFALLLAPWHAVGGRDAVFLFTPVAGVVLILLAYALGRQLAGEWVGLAAALMTASMPVLIFQVVQPMNDVTVAALWCGIVLAAVQPRDRSGWAGALTGLALLIRPNLAPAAMVVAAWFFMRGWRRLGWFVAAATPAVVVLLSLNAALYGHPLRSGYGEVGDLFGWRNVGLNAANYGSALWRTQLAFPLLAVVALPLAAPGTRRRVSLLLATSAAVIGVYLAYRPLPEWWYLRFLLPVLPLLTVLALMAVSRSGRSGWPALLAAVLVGGFAMTSPPMREALSLTQFERRFRTAGAVARERVSPETVFFTVWNSGTVRYHADRDAVLWDAFDPQALDAALEWLAARGREPVLMLEDWEEPLFRDRFAAHSQFAALDWPPRFDIDRRVKVYWPSDRARYLRGEPVRTEIVRSDGR